MANFTDNAALAVAHPDDEVLWFSAILKSVDNIVFCFSDCEKIDSLGHARRKVLSEYPLKNFITLDLPEANTFSSVDWQNPQTRNYGIEIASDARVRERYQRNFEILCERLRPTLKNYQNIITHNPWGEYGHPDHIQVYRAIKTLKSELNFNIWYSNYCGDHSINLALEYMSGFDCDYELLPTDIELASRLCKLYKEHDCWTWFDDYKWFSDEAYMQDYCSADAPNAYGRLFPFNMIKTSFPPTPSKISDNFRSSILKSISRWIRRRSS